jgi:hypothetical protein
MADDEHFVKPAKRASVLERDDEYRGNTPKQSWMTVEDALWQAHHIVCNHSVSQANIDEAVKAAGIDLSYAKDVIWITDWNLNNSDNMIGLPTNWQHRVKAGKNPPNRPSHQVDHNTTDGYTDECTKWLKNRVWNKIKDKGKTHQANAGTLKALLNAGSTYFRTHLGKRGCRKQGTAYCWAHRFETPPPSASQKEKDDYKQEPQWYFPFSMAEDDKVNERAVGYDWSESIEELRKTLKLIGK